MNNEAAALSRSLLLRGLSDAQRQAIDPLNLKPPRPFGWV